MDKLVVNLNKLEFLFEEKYGKSLYSNACCALGEYFFCNQLKAGAPIGNTFNCKSKFIGSNQFKNMYEKTGAQPN